MKKIISNWPKIKSALAVTKAEPMTRERGAKLIEGLHDRGTDRLLRDVQASPARRVLLCEKTTPRV